MGIIYCITNNLNGKRYVGQTIHALEERWNGHLNAARRDRNDMAILRAIRKYEEENFSIESLGEYDDDTLNENEVRWIDALGTYKNGYNSTLGGKSTKGYKFSEESRQKMSEKAKARGVSAEVIEKIAQINRGRKWTAEQLAKRIGKKRGKYKGLSQETRNKMSKARLGKKQPRSFFEKVCRPIECLNHNKEVVELYTSIKEAAQKLGVTSSTVRGYITGRIKKPRYLLRYVD